MAKITNRDIAQLAGVSPAAVSIAINGKPGISEETRRRILAIAREQNYLPGPGPRPAAEDRTRYIAALFRTDAHLEDQQFYADLAINAMVTCRERGYTLVITYITGEDGVIELPPAVRNGEMDGVLVFGDQEPSLFVELNRLRVPFVVLDSSSRTKNLIRVSVDYTQAAYQATRHLIDLGHRDIAYLSNGTLHDFNTLTLAGFQRATTEAGIALYPNRFQIDVEDDSSLEKCVDNALAGPKMPTAIFCTVDSYAINMMRYLQSKGLRIPEDISVVSIDDISASQLVSPALTTIHVDRKRMIDDGVAMLEELIEGHPCSSRTLPTPHLVVRDSTCTVK